MPASAELDLTEPLLAPNSRSARARGASCRPAHAPASPCQPVHHVPAVLCAPTRAGRFPAVSVAPGPSLPPVPLLTPPCAPLRRPGRVGGARRAAARGGKPSRAQEGASKGRLNAAGSSRPRAQMYKKAEASFWTGAPLPPGLPTRTASAHPAAQGRPLLSFRRHTTRHLARRPPPAPCGPAPHCTSQPLPRARRPGPPQAGRLAEAWPSGPAASRALRRRAAPRGAPPPPRCPSDAVAPAQLRR